MEPEDFIPGKLISGGARCEGCACYLPMGERVYTLSRETGGIGEFYYCLSCRPPEEEIPDGVSGLEVAMVVEELWANEETAGFEVKAGSSCRICDHVFETGEWLYVGVVERLYSGLVFCAECYGKLIGEMDD